MSFDMINGTYCQNRACLGPSYHHSAVEARNGFPVAAPHFIGSSEPNAPKAPDNSRELESVLQPIIEGRLFTSVDACADPSWSIAPQIGLEFDALCSTDKKTFLKCNPHQQYHKSVLDYIQNARKNPDSPPDRELLDSLCRPVTPEDSTSKKKYGCAMQGCKKVDTREHLRTHLLGLHHFKYRFFVCSACNMRFVQKPDKKRHINKKHAGSAQNDDEADQQANEQATLSNVGGGYMRPTQAQEQPIYSNAANIFGLNGYQLQPAASSTNGPGGVPPQLGTAFINNGISHGHFTPGLHPTLASSSYSHGYGYHPNASRPSFGNDSGHSPSSANIDVTLMRVRAPETRGVEWGMGAIKHKVVSILANHPPNRSSRNFRAQRNVERSHPYM